MKFQLKGKRVFLRKITPKDAQSIYDNVKDKEIARYTENIPYPYPKTDTIKFIKRSDDKIKKGKGYTFGITLKEDDQVLGIVSLNSIDHKNKSAELGYWLGKKYWGKGIISEAVRLILGFAFKNLKLHRVHAGVFEKNIASKRVLEKSGFKFEGLLREAVFKHGRWYNKLAFGILRKEYEAH